MSSQTHLRNNQQQLIHGIMNIGQTCYMSSVLQCLAHTEPIKNLFLSQVNDPASKHNTENSCTTVIQSGTLTKVFREFICQVWQNQQSTFNPQDIKRVIGNLNERFKGSNQEDAQEFLSYLIKGLHDELNEVNEKKYINMTVDPNDDDEVASNKLWDLYHKRENSKIVGIFYGQIKTSSQCPKCPYAERRFEVFSQLILPVSHGDEEADVEQCLKQFMSNEETELLCDNCDEFSTTGVDSQKMLFKLPQVLIIHLKRFEFSNKTQKLKKITKYIDIPLILDLSIYCNNQNTSYELYGFISHHGYSLAHGHYTAHVKHNGHWYLCDDTIVTESTFSETVTKNAYILFYKIKQEEDGCLKKCCIMTKHKNDQLQLEKKQYELVNIQLQQNNEKLNLAFAQLQNIYLQQMQVVQQNEAEVYDNTKNFQQESNILYEGKDHSQDENLRQIEQLQDQLQHEKNQLQQEKDQLQYEKDQLQQENNQLQHEKDQLQQEKDQLQQEKDQLQQEKDRHQQEFVQYIHELKQETIALNDINDKLKQDKNYTELLWQQESAKFHQITCVYQSEHVQLTQKNKQLQTDMEHLKNRNDHLQQEKYRLQEEKNFLQQDKTSLQQENNRLLQENNRYRHDNNQYHHENNQYRYEKNLLQQQVDDLNQWKCSLCIPRDKIDITNEVISKGAWGEVKVANFRGQRVAAKCFNDIIVVHFNISVFTYEMEIASKVQHHNLVQFIGASREGIPSIILYELMPISLRQQLEINPLTRPQIKTISQDVSCALNYLHSYKPYPIIHYDVSSSNVFLELSETGQLKAAKLTTYGLTDFLADTSLHKANLLHKSSLHKVNVHYSAAEIHNYSLATDVYSFGVLLMVMALNKEPPKTDVLRQSLLELIKWESLQHIIRQCINRYHNLRPSISKVHDSLQKL